MDAFYHEEVVRKGQGKTDLGFIIERGSRPSSIEELNKMRYNGDAYKVEVFETSKGVHVRRMGADSREIAELEDKIELDYQGIENTIVQKTGEPLMPSEYSNPDRAIEMYSKYAKEHGITSSLQMENVNWQNLLEK